MTDINADLARLQNQWTEAKAGGGIVLPDGNYSMQIMSANVGKSQSGRLQVAFNFKVLIGEHAGKTLPNYQGLDNPQSIGFFKQFMARIEQAPPDNITELPAWVGRLVGVQFLANVKNKDGFCNVYMQKRITVDTTAGATGGVPGMGAPAAAPSSTKLGM